MYTHAKPGRFRPILHLLLGAAALFAAGLAIAGEPPAQAELSGVQPGDSELTVRVILREGMPDRGEVRFALFGTPADYQKGRKLLDRTAPVRDGQAELPLRGLPPGRYAFRLFHDANANGQLDTGAFGLPVEPIFYSNDASDMFSAPEWEEASFRLSEGTYAYEVRLD